jgi:hypothetical protein
MAILGTLIFAFAAIRLLPSPIAKTTASWLDDRDPIELRPGAGMAGANGWRVDMTQMTQVLRVCVMCVIGE